MIYEHQGGGSRSSPSLLDPSHHLEVDVIKIINVQVEHTKKNPISIAPWILNGFSNKQNVTSEKLNEKSSRKLDKVP